jgi:hypothetical protein
MAGTGTLSFSERWNIKFIYWKHRSNHSRTQGALAKSITGYHKNMVRKQYPMLELANQMPIRIWIWPEPLVAPRVRRALGTRMRSNRLYSRKKFGLHKENVHH